MITDYKKRRVTADIGAVCIVLEKEFLFIAPGRYLIYCAGRTTEGQVFNVYIYSRLLMIWLMYE